MGIDEAASASFAIISGSRVTATRPEKPRLNWREMERAWAFQLKDVRRREREREEKVGFKRRENEKEQWKLGF